MSIIYQNKITPASHFASSELLHFKNVSCGMTGTFLRFLFLLKKILKIRLMCSFPSKTLFRMNQINCCIYDSNHKPPSSFTNTCGGLLGVLSLPSISASIYTWPLRHGATTASSWYHITLVH